MGFVNRQGVAIELQSEVKVWPRFGLAWFRGNCMHSLRSNGPIIPVGLVLQSFVLRKLRWCWPLVIRSYAFKFEVPELG